MKVNYVCEKGSGKLNEDNYIIRNNLFGVFDGMTSLEKYIDQEGKTGGYLASSIANEVFEKDDKRLKELALEANKSIREEMRQRDIDQQKKVNLWSTEAAVIRIQDNYMHWAQVGDCLISLIYKDNSYKLLLEDDERDKENLIMWKELKEKGVKNAWDQMTPYIKKVRERMNIDYGAMDGEKEMVNFLYESSEDLTDVKHVLLFTDGIFLPKKDPAEADDFRDFVNLYLEGGLQKVKDYVRAMEKEDPDCSKYPRFKKHDDIAAVSITFD